MNEEGLGWPCATCPAEAIYILTEDGAGTFMCEDCYREWRVATGRDYGNRERA